MMTFVCCPSCHWPAVLPESKRGQELRHRCLNCGVEYDTATAPVLPDMRGQPAPTPTARTEPAAPLPDTRFRLTSPHHCASCGGNLPPVGTRRTDVCCPHCDRKTAVYAVLYRCPECNEQLETPRERRGQMDRCPKCNEQLVVPSDVLFNDERDTPNHTWFAFNCPGCAQGLESRRSATRSTVVCPHCLRVLTVPLAGEPIMPSPRPAGDVVEVLHATLAHSCPHCGRHVPALARTCRACGNQLP